MNKEGLKLIVVGIAASWYFKGYRVVVWLVGGWSSKGGEVGIVLPGAGKAGYCFRDFIPV
ncbi:hypothetical protein LCGC14_3005710 [marine sediment metagenome]|uniref:Uncharacterized protein n=1 Tax=marine sediment metagenome TaxID=412755 RepID=A0A0F8XMD9_9ZZZZ